MSSDNDRKTPVEIVVSRRRRWWVAIVILLLLALVYYLTFVNQYVIAFRSQLDHFKHGSIGSETATGPPYWVFKALPVMYPDKLGPDGWARLGFLYEKPDDDLPIGVSRRVVSGVERVWLNCSVCHVGTYRLAGDPVRHFIPGAPSNNLRLQEFIRFFIYVGRDPGFNADALIAAINSDEVGGNLNIFERLIYRYVVFPRVKNAFLELGTQLAFVDRQQKWGPGRVDTFNPYKALQFNFPMDAASISDDALDGSSDFPAIWRQRPREGMNLHWDGNNDSVAERNLSAALGAGVTPVTVDRPAIARIEAWMWDLPAPVFPQAAKINTARALKGKELFRTNCAACHGFKENDVYSYDVRQYPKLGKTVPLDEIGTDPGRWNSYTQDFAAAQNLLYAGYPWQFSRFHKTDGYANHPLDGIWARSPYLHNGSVPTLRDLLDPTGKRPKIWTRGGEEFDPVKVGYRYEVLKPEDDKADLGSLFRYDTRLRGNRNTGHEYGTTLPDDAKDALVEYMKTL